jgi:alkylated DNA repair dioxygenase AlkB
METPIKTRQSFLTVQPLGDIELIPRCIEEVQGKLLVNPQIVVYGKPAVQHRSIGFFLYEYSGQVARSQPLSPALKELLTHINTLFDTDMNGILVNHYADGCDYIGAHADKGEIAPIGVIAVSYGCVRKFRIRDATTKKIVMDIPTRPNEIMHMGGKFQREFTHEIPKETKIRDARWSFTFRKHN